MILVISINYSLQSQATSLRCIHKFLTTSMTLSDSCMSTAHRPSLKFTAVPHSFTPGYKIFAAVIQNEKSELEELQYVHNHCSV